MVNFRGWCILFQILLTGWIHAQIQNAEFSVIPNVFDENDTIRIEVRGVSPETWGDDGLYLWAWSFDQDGKNPIDAPGNGTWNQSGEDHRLDELGDGVYGLTLIPSEFFNREGIGKFGILVKAKNGNGDKKSQDFLVDVGAFDFHLLLPHQTRTILDSADTISIRAKTSEYATFTLFADGEPVHSIDIPDSVYEHDVTIDRNTTFMLHALQGDFEQTLRFTVLIKPEINIAELPENLKDGIHIHSEDSTSWTFVLYAPEKDWVHLIGNFNDWQIDDRYLMNLDTLEDRFWIILDNLEPKQDILYQYLVEFDINIADPYAPLILDPFHDDFIDSTLWQHIPAYPSDHTNQAVTWIPVSSDEYEWQIHDFTPPDRSQLLVYELLVRDFDLRHSFDAVRDRLDYLQELGINAIELMPVNEFDGNESWGYNPSFHMALDKYYGSPDALKRLVDECHARGMAVILDVVFNHASGQNPFVRLWNDCNGCLEGKPTPDNPFFNPDATHSYSVFHDFNHQSAETHDYVRRSIEYWITEFRIDGFRWDLTKGFTQNCTGGSQEACTNAYQTDRVEVLKSYADMQWNINPDFLVIFEHLGVGTSRDEEREWAHYRMDENPGIMLWNNLNYAYSEAAMGYHDGGKSDFSSVYGPDRDLPMTSTLSYMESHDEERLTFKMHEYGNGSGDYQIPSTKLALNRLKLSGAFFFTLPGPKMIWQFGELGYDYSIDHNGRTGNKPIRWDYAQDPERMNVYKTFQALISLRNSDPVFTSAESTVTTSLAGEFKRIILEHSETNVVIAGNFGVVERTGQPHFPKAGKWYDYFSGDSITILQTDTTLSLDPGQFHIFTNRKFETPEQDILTNSSSFEDVHQTGSIPYFNPNFPNPFNQQTRISYVLPYSSHVSLQIFDVTGRKIKTLVDHFQTAGAHHLTFPSMDLGPGIYFSHLITRNHTAVQKMIRH